MIISIDIVAVLSLSLHSSIHTSVSSICMNGDSETFKCGSHTHRQRKREEEYAHIPSKWICLIRLGLRESLIGLFWDNSKIRLSVWIYHPHDVRLMCTIYSGNCFETAHFNFWLLFSRRDENTIFSGPPFFISSILMRMKLYEMKSFFILISNFEFVWTNWNITWENWLIFWNAYLAF